MQVEVGRRSIIRPDQCRSISSKRSEAARTGENQASSFNFTIGRRRGESNHWQVPTSLLKHADHYCSGPAHRQLTRSVTPGKRSRGGIVPPPPRRETVDRFLHPWLSIPGKGSNPSILLSMLFSLSIDSPGSPRDACLRPGGRGMSLHLMATLRPVALHGPRPFMSISCLSLDTCPCRLSLLLLLSLAAGWCTQ